MSQPPTNSFRCPFLGRLHDLDDEAETLEDTPAGSPLDDFVADVVERASRPAAAGQVDPGTGSCPGSGPPGHRAVHPGWRRQPAV
jgi:hypothetical protein